jgi:hypothetical protein
MAQPLEEIEQQGEKLLLALYTQNRWIIRTVDRVSFVDRNTVRRRIVRHFTKPPDREAQPRIDSKIILPVFTLRKKSFISCDLRDAGDRRLALRPIEERWELTFQALMSLVRAADPIAAKDPRLQQLARELVTRQHASQERKQLLEYGKALKNQAPRIAALVQTQSFLELTNYLSRNYLVFVDIEPGVSSHIISYVVDQRIPNRTEDFEGARMSHPPRRRFRKKLGLVPHQYFHPWTISGAGSNHLEIKAPDGVEIGRRKLQLPNRQAIRTMGTSTRHARFLAPRTVPSGEAYARIDIMPGAGVMRKAGPAVLFFLAFLLSFVALTDVKAGPGAALLLALPSLTAYIAARPSEHPYVTDVVLWVRIMTLSPIPLAALGTAVLLAGWSRWALVPFIMSALTFGLILAIGERRLRERTNYFEVVADDLTRVA